MFLAASQKSDGSYGTNLSTLDNVVFDDFSSGSTSLGSITALGNELTTSTNVYPPALNQLLAGHRRRKRKTSRYPCGSAEQHLRQHDVGERSVAGLSLLGHDAVRQRGTLRLPGHAAGSGGGDQPSERDTCGGRFNHSERSGAADHVTNHAVCAGQLWQTARAALDRLPALTNQVLFYEGSELIGTGSLSANGTLATFTVNNISEGTHTYTAQYPADQYYDTLDFGSVTVVAQPH